MITIKIFKELMQKLNLIQMAIIHINITYLLNTSIYTKDYVFNSLL